MLVSSQTPGEVCLFVRKRIAPILLLVSHYIKLSATSVIILTFQMFSWLKIMLFICFDLCWIIQHTYFLACSWLFKRVSNLSFLVTKFKWEELTGFNSRLEMEKKPKLLIFPSTFKSSMFGFTPDVIQTLQNECLSLGGFSNVLCFYTYEFIFKPQRIIQKELILRYLQMWFLQVELKWLRKLLFLSYG